MAKKKMDRLLVDLIVAHPEHVGEAVRKMAAERDEAIELLKDAFPAVEECATDGFTRALAKDVKAFLLKAGIKAKDIP